MKVTLYYMYNRSMLKVANDKSLARRYTMLTAFIAQNSTAIAESDWNSNHKYPVHGNMTVVRCVLRKLLLHYAMHRAA